MTCDNCGSEDVRHLNFHWDTRPWNLCEPCWEIFAAPCRIFYGVATLGELSREELQTNADERNKLRALLKKWGQPSTWPDAWRTEEERLSAKKVSK